MSSDIGLSRGYAEQDPQGGDTWRRWLSRAGRGWRMHCASHRRCVDARLKLGFERVPPRVWARHGALLTSVRGTAQARGQGGKVQ